MFKSKRCHLKSSYKQLFRLAALLPNLSRIVDAKAMISSFSSTSSKSAHPKFSRVSNDNSIMMAASDVEPNDSWLPGTALLNWSPSILSKKGENHPRLAKDVNYASAILNAWKADLDSRRHLVVGSVSAPYVYQCQGDGSFLHGHVYRPSPPPLDPSATPGIVLFHTGAGPQDLFLRWKADTLVCDGDVFGENGCVVLVADLIGDGVGWAWDGDRSRYENVRSSLLVTDERGERENLRRRVQAAIDAISAQRGVDPQRIGALGFCFGGHAILELGRMKIPSVRAMATFHGVFDGARMLSSFGRSSEGRGESAAKSDVLIFTGDDDPFVSAEELNAAVAVLRGSGYDCNVMRFENTRHGFTNPAQDFNPSPAFAYNEEASTQAWSATRKLLKESLSIDAA